MRSFERCGSTKACRARVASLGSRVEADFWAPLLLLRGSALLSCRRPSVPPCSVSPQGTASTEEMEFGEAYRLSVVHVPPHRPSRRADTPLQMYIYGQVGGVGAPAVTLLTALCHRQPRCQHALRRCAPRTAACHGPTLAHPSPTRPSPPTIHS